MKQDFDDAAADYAEFLKKCGCAPRILWVTPEDALFTRSPSIYIRLVREGRAAESRKEYEAGLTRRLGVEFRMLCELNGSSCCFVWFPRNREEAMRMMMPEDGSLKMSALREASIARVTGIRNWLVWEFLRRRYEKNGDLYGYPFGDASGFVAKIIS